jgi:hypothetical protein
MFKRILFKSVAGAAAAGTILAGAAAMTAPVVTTVSPEITNVACHLKYPNSAVTLTRLTLDRSIGQYGSNNGAHVRVTSDTGQPNGQVTVRIVGLRSWTVHLHNGRAAVSFPFHMDAQHTYTVRSHYTPPSCSHYKASSSDAKFYTVRKADTHVIRLHARDISGGENPRVSAEVTSATGQTPRGDVRVKLFKNNEVRQVMVVGLRGGEMTAEFDAVTGRGNWDVRVAYLGNSDYQRDSSSTTFRVRR